MVSLLYSPVFSSGAASVDQAGVVKSLKSGFFISFGSPDGLKLFCSSCGKADYVIFFTLFSLNIFDSTCYLPYITRCIIFVFECVIIK